MVHCHMGGRHIHIRNEEIAVDTLAPVVRIETRFLLAEDMEFTRTYSDVIVKRFYPTHIDITFTIMVDGSYAAYAYFVTRNYSPDPDTGHSPNYDAAGVPICRAADGSLYLSSHTNGHYAGALPVIPEWLQRVADAMRERGRRNDYANRAGKA